MTNLPFTPFLPSKDDHCGAIKAREYHAANRVATAVHTAAVAAAIRKTILNPAFQDRQAQDLIHYPMSFSPPAPCPKGYTIEEWDMVQDWERANQLEQYERTHSWARQQYLQGRRLEQVVHHWLCEAGVEAYLLPSVIHGRDDEDMKEGDFLVKDAQGNWHSIEVKSTSTNSRCKQYTNVRSSFPSSIIVDNVRAFNAKLTNTATKKYMGETVTAPLLAVIRVHEATAGIVVIPVKCKDLWEIQENFYNGRTNTAIYRAPKETMRTWDSLLTFLTQP